MSATGTRLAPQPEFTGGERSPLAYLVHAINQPLTGLQCSLELAAAAPRRSDQYVRTLHEGLTLTARMRVLVEAIRELAESGDAVAGPPQPFELNLLVRDAVDDLVPVAREKQIAIVLSTGESIPVEADRRCLAALMFRLLDSALSLAAAESELRISAQAAGERARLRVSWVAGHVPEHSPFSRPELGLLVARAGWERAAAEWTSFASDGIETCVIDLPSRSRESSASRPSRPQAATIARDATMASEGERA